MKKNKFLLLIIKLLAIVSIIASLALSQNTQDLLKLKKEYERSRKNEDSNSIMNNSIEMDTDIEDTDLRKISIYRRNNNLMQTVDSVNISKNYFGYSFFSRRDTVSFWENLPPPPNYILGPGDEIIISLWGQTQLRKRYEISRDGKIFDQPSWRSNINR